MTGYLLAAILLPALTWLYLTNQSLAQRMRQVEETLGDGWVTEAVAELERVSGELDKRLGDSAAALETLIAAADQRLASLEQARSEPGPVAAPAEDDRYGEVVKLARMGLDTEEIARQANVGRGEVELALRLRRAASE